MGVFSLCNQGNSQIWLPMIRIPFLETKDGIHFYLAMCENLTSSVKITWSSSRKYGVYLQNMPFRILHTGMISFKITERQAFWLQSGQCWGITARAARYGGPNTASGGPPGHPPSRWLWAQIQAFPRLPGYVEISVFKGMDYVFLTQEDQWLLSRAQPHVPLSQKEAVTGRRLTAPCSSL